MLLNKMWFPYTKIEKSSKKKNVFCFHHAGGSGINFSKWDMLSDKVRFIPAEMPGRGARICDKYDHCFKKVVYEITEAVKKEVDTLEIDDFVFYGHSMGAIIAFSVACCIKKKYKISPKVLFVVARHAPQMPDPSVFKSTMSDESLIDEMKRLGGTPDEILNNREYMNMFINRIRNDYKLHEDYNYGNEKLDIPIIAHTGDNDYGADVFSMTKWFQLTSKGAAVEEFKGGHFFPYELGEKYVRHLIDEVSFF